MSVKHTTGSIFPCCFPVLDSIVVFLYYWYMADQPCLACVFFCVKLYQIWGVIWPVGFHKYFAAIMIDRQKKHKTRCYLSVLTVTGSQTCTTSAVCGSRGVEPGSPLRRTSLLVIIRVKETISPSQRCRVCYFQRQCLSSSHIRLCLPFGELGSFVWRE